MRLSALFETQVQDAAKRIWSTDPASDGAIAEVVRAELWARRVVTRRVVCSSVLERMERARPVDLDAVKGVLAQMERAGDVTVGEAGFLAAAPLRAIRIEDDVWLLAGGPETARLEVQLGCNLVPRGALRTAVAVPGAGDRLRDGITAAGGVLLSPERWAGLVRTPIADSAWLDALDAELAHAPATSTVMEPEGLDWRFYAPEREETNDKLRWKKPTEGSAGRLWRAWHDRGYWVHTWTGGGAPIDASRLRLTSDEAHRSRFALARVAGYPVALRMSAEGSSVRLEATHLLPSAEYRFLLTLGQRDLGAPIAYNFPLSVWPRVEAMLATRLGALLLPSAGAP